MSEFLYKSFIFLMFLGPLIFFHELGHFLFAKYFGVRVETFSIGFGPKIFKFKRGDTTYAFSLIPLGGYVKMYGDNILEKDELPEDQKRYAFTHKTKWQRFWIVFGGPFANFLLAYVIFFSLLISGEKVPEAKIGILAKDSMLYKNGIRSGDVVKKINDSKIIGFTDFASSGIEEVNSVTVERDSLETKLDVSMSAKDFIEQSMTFPPLFRAPLVTNAKSETFGLTYIPTKVDESVSLHTFAADKAQKAYLVKLKEFSMEKREFDYSYVEQVNLPQGQEKFEDFLETKGLYPVDVVVRSLVLPSPAEQVGVKAKDILLSVNDNRIKRLEEFRSYMQTVNPEELVTLVVLRDGVEKTFSFKPEVKEINGEKRNAIGIFGTEIYVSPKLVNTDGMDFMESLVQAHVRTWQTIVATLSGYKKLIVGDVSFKSVGGPIAIAKVASDSFGISLSYFIKIMALLSVNLGIINLFPIPVLDGGHIMFILIELIKGKPVSRRIVEISLQFGVSVLFLLIFAAIFNDMSRLLG